MADTGVGDDLHRPQARTGGDTDNALAVVERGCGAGDMRAVAASVATGVVETVGSVIRRSGHASRAVGSADHVEVRVLVVDAAIEDGDIGIDTAVDAVEAEQVIRGRKGTRDSRRRRLLPVGLDRVIRLYAR